MDERALLILSLLLLSNCQLQVTAANLFTSLFKYFNHQSKPDSSRKFIRLKRITEDEGKNAIGLGSEQTNFTVIEKENFSDGTKDEEIGQTLKDAERKDFTKLKTRSLPEDQNETKIVEKRTALSAKQNYSAKNHFRKERSRSFEKVNSREEKEMSSIKTLSSHSVPVERSKAEQSGSGEEDGTPLVEVYQWPKGCYGIPKSTYGCPSTFGFHWKTGFRYHDTEDDGTENQRSDVFHLAANFSEDGISHEFCIKDDSDVGEGGWPPGKYCIYKRGPTCPDGLSEGFVIWDDENTDNQNDKGGVLPEGQYTEDTKIYFCCSTHGFADKDIPLPSKKPFFLFAYESLKCQKVLNMRSTSEFIKFDDEDHGNTDYEGGEFPYGIHNFQKDHMLFLCYYEPTAEQTVNAAPALMTNLEEENAQNTSDIDQESLLQSEEMMRAFMKATGGVEDESNKKERTKTIIKTIKPKSTNIENRVQIRPILYSLQPIRLQIFFRVPVKGRSSPVATVIGLVLGSIVIGSAFLLIAKIYVQKSNNQKKAFDRKVSDLQHLKGWGDMQVKTLKESKYVPAEDAESVVSDNISDNNSDSVYTAPDTDSWSDLEGDDDELVEDQLLPDSELKTGLELLFLKQQRHYWNQRRRHERRDTAQ